jgi:ketosteroid isomerase-like protein
MKRVLLLMLIVVAFAVNGTAQKASLAPDLQSLVDTERAFARTATEKGVRDSFLAFIADDGILYRPGPVNGKDWLTPRPSRPGLLTWQPVFAELSAAGDLGITTGPWEFREKGPEDAPVCYGQFATVWRKQADGKWKFVMDIGISHDKPAAAAIPWQLPAGFNREKVAKSNVEATKVVLSALDQNFSKASVANGAVKAYQQFGADDIRLLRNGSYPILGKKDALSFLAAKPGSLSWLLTKADVAGSFDLGYTYGTYEFKGSGTDAKTESGYYMRVWKRRPNGGWSVVLEVFNELPKPAAN